MTLKTGGRNLLAGGTLVRRPTVGRFRCPIPSCRSLWSAKNATACRLGVRSTRFTCRHLGQLPAHFWGAGIVSEPGNSGRHYRLGLQAKNNPLSQPERMVPPARQYVKDRGGRGRNDGSHIIPASRRCGLPWVLGCIGQCVRLLRTRSLSARRWRTHIEWVRESPSAVATIGRTHCRC